MTVHPSVGFVPGVCTAPLIQALAPVRAVSELNRTDGQQPLHSRLRYGLCRYVSVLGQVEPFTISVQAASKSRYIASIHRQTEN